MNNWHWRARYFALVITSGGLLLANSCALSDRQLATVWQSVLQSALNSIMGNVITAAFDGTAAA